MLALPNMTKLCLKRTGFTPEFIAAWPTSWALTLPLSAVLPPQSERTQRFDDSS
jgi:hypothetical protein